MAAYQQYQAAQFQGQGYQGQQGFQQGYGSSYPGQAQQNDKKW